MRRSRRPRPRSRILTPVAPEPVGYRVGFHKLGEEPVGFGGGGKPIIWLDVNDWDPTVAAPNQLTAWYDKLFGISVSTFKTPTLGAMMRIGNLVETGGSARPCRVDQPAARRGRGPVPDQPFDRQPGPLHEQLPHPVHGR